MALVQPGLKPADALRMATIDAALSRGVPATEGSIEQGKAAGLVLLRSNPLSDIRRKREIGLCFGLTTDRSELYNSGHVGPKLGESVCIAKFRRSLTATI